MTLAFQFSAQLGLLPSSDAERVERHLATVGLPTRLSDMPGGCPDADRLMELMAQDKKVRRGRLTFILARGIGAAFIAPDVEAADVRTFIAEKLSGRC
jgi:3-dehydroquinate synthetase